MGHPNTDNLQVINIDLSVIRADLPAFTSKWSKCFVQIHVDGSPNPVCTKPTRKAGKHEWGERFSLPARSETILRFELKRNEFLNLRQQSLAFAEAPISDLLVSRQQSGGMGESVDVLSVDDDCVGQGKIRIFRYTFGHLLIDKMGTTTIGDS